MADKKNYTVVSPLVIAKTPTGDLYLYQDVPVPELADDEIKRLVEGGFIAEVAEADEAIVVPDGDPSKEWTVKQLTAFAKANGTDLGEARNKDDILAVLVSTK